MLLVFRLFFPILLVFGGFYGFRQIIKFVESSEYFAIKSIEIENDKSPILNKQIRKHLSSELGKNIFSVKLTDLESKVQSYHRISNAAVSRILPSTIRIRYILQKAVAIINLGSFYYVNSKGEIIDQLTESDSVNFPLITVDERTKFGTDLSQENIKRALEVIAWIRSSSLLSLADLGDIRIRSQHYQGMQPLSITLSYPPSSLRNDLATKNYLTITLQNRNMFEQMRRAEAVLRQLVTRKQVPKLIRLELGKKVVVKVDQ